MQELLHKEEREALALINSKGNLRKITIRKKTNFIRKAHASVVRNLATLLGIT